MKSLFFNAKHFRLVCSQCIFISDLDLVLKMFLVFVSLSYPPFIYRLNFKLGFYLNNAILSYIFFVLSFYHDTIHAKRIEYILERNLLEKSVKRPFCCNVSILQVCFTYFRYLTFWALEHHFKENLKLILKENQIIK